MQSKYNITCYNEVTYTAKLYNHNVRMTEHPQLKYGMAEFLILRNDGISSNAKGGSYIELQFWVKYFPF